MMTEKEFQKATEEICDKDIIFNYYLDRLAKKIHARGETKTNAAERDELKQEIINASNRIEKMRWN